MFSTQTKNSYGKIEYEYVELCKGVCCPREDNLIAKQIFIMDDEVEMINCILGEFFKCVFVYKCDKATPFCRFMGVVVGPPTQSQSQC